MYASLSTRPPAAPARWTCSPADAKSIMGLFSLDLSHPVKVEVHGSDADRSAFEQSVAAFEVKQTQ